MRGIDFELYRFDFDLTFAALLMNADGTIYHNYGGRDWTDAQSHLSMRAFVEVLQKTLKEHEAYQKDPKPPKKRKKRTVERMPFMKKRKAPECYHCHMVHDALREELRDRRRWKKERDAWDWPDPVEIGLKLDKDDQARVNEVIAKSPAAAAGLKPGDRLLTLDARSILSFGDVQRVLDETPYGSATLPVTWERGDEAKSGKLKLGTKWRAADPLTFSWRPAKWQIKPYPGFGGKKLGPAELGKLGLAKDAFAIRIGYLVTWGDRAYSGNNARRAGLRKGDVILSVDGKDDFVNEPHFQAWFRLTRNAKKKIQIVRLRNGKKTTIHLTVVD